MVLQYKPGKENVVADALSRRSDTLDDDRLPALPIMQQIHGNRNYEDHALGAVNTNEVSATSRTYDLIPDGMFRAGYLAG